MRQINVFFRIKDWDLCNINYLLICWNCWYYVAVPLYGRPGLDVGYTGARYYTVVLRKHTTHMESPSTAVGWTSTGRHTHMESPSTAVGRTSTGRHTHMESPSTAVGRTSTGRHTHTWSHHRQQLVGRLPADKLSEIGSSGNEINELWTKLINYLIFFC